MVWHPSVTDLLPICVVINSMRRTVSQPPSGLGIPLAAGELDYAKSHSAPRNAVLCYLSQLEPPSGIFSAKERTISLEYDGAHV